VSLLAPLLDVQQLDLECDHLIKQRATLPERDTLRRNREQAATLDTGLAELEAERTRLDRAEHTLGGEVAEVASKAKEVEDRLYSGSVKVSKELAGLQQELDGLRARQGQIEEQELELLEEIDTTDASKVTNRADRDTCNAECTEIQATLGKAEADIDGQLAVIAGKRAELATGLPEAVLSHYAKLRENPRMLGRAAAPLADGGCGGCRIKLPVLEYHRIKAEPEDALVCCVHCHRVFVR
jgi:predicted  nucleic acid-binding Zn-ribbon protein